MRANPEATSPPGSVGPSVTVEQPLPPALAYSDAAVIGEVAGRSAFDKVENEQIDWVNGATGSVGTWKAGPQIASEEAGNCRAFGATVTGDRRDEVEQLAIPPAWTDVWISPDPRGYLQASGNDEAGRKQYRYHDDYRRVRDRPATERGPRS